MGLMANVPNLAKHEGSWVVVRKGTLSAVLETFDRKRAEAVNAELYEVITIGDYLGRYSAKVRTNNG